LRCRGPLRTAHARSRAHGPSKPLGRFRFWNRLEDPAPQPPCLLLAARQSTPSQASRRTPDAGPLVRSPKCSTCPLVPAFASASFQRLTCPSQRPSGLGHQPDIRPVIQRPSGGVPGPAAPAFLLPFGRRHLLPGHPVPPGNSAPLTVGLPPRLRIPAPARRTLTRFTRSARVRPRPGRALSLPREQRYSPAIGASAAAACRLSAAGPCHPGKTTQPGVCT